MKARKNNNPRDLFSALASKYPNGIKISGGVELSNGKFLRRWKVFIPTHLIKVVDGFNPRNGWAYDENIKNTYGFLLLVSSLGREGFKSLDEYHLIADYAIKIGKGLEAWKEEMARSSKSLTKGTSVFYNHGMKLIANPEIGYEVVDGVSIPRVILDESNPLVIANPDNPKLSMAIGKDGKFVKLLGNGDIVFVHRNPVIDLTPCVVKISRGKKVCGSYVVAMSPSALVWSSHSDVDGDVLWLIPGKQVGINSLEQAGKLMSHPLVGKEIAESTMKIFDPNAGLVASVISKPNAEFSLDINQHLVREYMADEYAVFKYPIYADRVKAHWAEVVVLAEKTSNHYVINTGKGYQCMFNAYSKFVSDALSGNINQQRIVLIGIKATSFVIYEEWALSGYDSATEAHFVKLDDQAKELLGTKKKFVSSRANRFITISINPSLNLAINLCASYMAMAKVQSMIENSNKVKENDKEQEYASINLAMANLSSIHFDAVRFGLFRTLTKGAFAYGDSSRINPIFAKHYSNDDNNPYQPVISAWVRIQVLN